MPASSRIRELLGTGSALRDNAALLPGWAGTAGWPEQLATGLGGGYLSAAVDNSRARVRVDLYWPGIRRAIVERVHADGTTYQIRGGDPARMLTAWARWDYEAPLDQAVYYRATSTERDGSEVTTAAVTVLSGGRGWITHPTKPYLNRAWTLRAIGPRNRDSRASALRPPLRRYPLYVHGVRAAQSGQVSLRIDDATELAALDELLDDNSDLLLRLPAVWGGQYWYIAVGQTSAERGDPMYGELQLEAVAVPFDVVGMPPGVDAGGDGNTYADLGDAFAMYTQAAASASTYVELSMATY